MFDVIIQQGPRGGGLNTIDEKASRFFDSCTKIILKEKKF